MAMNGTKMMTSFAARQLLTAVLLLFCFQAIGEEKERETYHILQKGYIRIEGATNLFNFSGESIQHTGKLEESAEDDYTGVITLRFDQISFPFPGVHSVLKDPEYMDSERYSTIEIKLDHFNPHHKLSYVQGTLALRNVERKVQIQIDLVDISPIVKAEGHFTVKQSDFQVPLYKSGVLRIEDPLKISFQLYFCETHDEIPDDDHLDNPQLQAILTRENIIVLSEPTFFGCEELKP
jgi:YceI-like protein